MTNLIRGTGNPPDTRDGDHLVVVLVGSDGVRAELNDLSKDFLGEGNDTAIILSFLEGPRVDICVGI